MCYPAPVNKEPFGHLPRPDYTARLKELRLRGRMITNMAVFLSLGLVLLLFFELKLLTPERMAQFPVAVWFLRGAMGLMFLICLALAPMGVRVRWQVRALQREFEAEQAALTAARKAHMN